MLPRPVRWLVGAAVARLRTQSHPVARAAVVAAVARRRRVEFAFVRAHGTEADTGPRLASSTAPGVAEKQ